MINLRREVKINELPAILRQLFRDEAIGGRLILLAALAAVIATNTFWQNGYHGFWQTEFHIGAGSWVITQSLQHWVNEGLMTIFFLVVGLEIKREIIGGELKSLRIAILPIVAAIGGMLIPALIYLAINIGNVGVRGWGIPMATDIAIAIGLLMLLGKRIPSKLKIFLLALAIIDDIGAIIVIALFYNQAINLLALLGAVIVIALMTMLNRSRFMTISVFAVLGFCLWVAFYESGINASITGVILGLLAPLTTTKANKHPITLRLEKALLPASTFVIVPLFVFANAGLTFKTDAFQEPGALTTTLGIVAGLVVGKVVGITAAAWLAIKFGLASLPANTNWSQFIGVGFLAGVGFTVSIFVTGLAFSDSPNLIDAAKIGIFIGSILSAGLGVYSLKRNPTPSPVRK